MKNKLALLLLIFFSSCTHGYSQLTIILDMLDGFNKLTSGITTLATSYEKIDNETNKKKVGVLIGDLSKDIGDLIIVKGLIINKLQNNLNTSQDYTVEINKLQASLTSLTTTLIKGQDLFQAAGVNAQELIFELKKDYYSKLNTLNNIKTFLGSHSLTDIQTKRILITYFTTCINLLNNSKKELRITKIDLP